MSPSVPEPETARWPRFRRVSGTRWLTKSLHPRIAEVRKSALKLRQPMAVERRGAGIPGLCRPGLIEAGRRRPLGPRMRYRILGLCRPGLIEARRPARRRRPSRSRVFRGFVAPASLKLRLGAGSRRRRCCIPGLCRPGLIEAEVESPRGISPRGAHRTVREPLGSHGSSYAAVR